MKNGGFIEKAAALRLYKFDILFQIIQSDPDGVQWVFHAFEFNLDITVVTVGFEDFQALQNRNDSVSDDCAA